MSQQDENSMDSASSPNTPNPSKDKESSANEDEQDEEDEDVLVQFDFEATMKAKNSLTVSNSSSNLVGLKVAGQLKPTEEVPSETDKERLEVKAKKVSESTAFDMFAEDDEYETVSDFEFTIFSRALLFNIFTY